MLLANRHQDTLGIMGACDGHRIRDGLSPEPTNDR